MTQDPTEDADPVGAIMVVIGGRNMLDDSTLTRMSEALNQSCRAYPEIEIILIMDGYDEDSRSIWEIPEAADYIRRFAAHSGLENWTSYPFLQLETTSKGLLVRCNAIRHPHPFQVVVVPDPVVKPPN